MDAPLEPPILIVGAGLVGLTLAQALKKMAIPCVVYERDVALDTERGGGWAITIHWALQALEECLPRNLFEELDSIQVDPEQGVRDTGRFLFLNMATAVPKYEIPPSKRKRVNRLRLRHLLARGIDIRFSSRLVDIAAGDGNTVTAKFEKGHRAAGSLLVGCDGTSSKLRRILFGNDPKQAELNQLPVRALGTTIQMTEEQVQPLRRIDPLLFQGCHPGTGVFLWYSTVSSPPLNGSIEDTEPYYESQLILSWLYKSSDDDVPESNEDRRHKMLALVKGFDARLETAVHSIREGTEVKEVQLQDWPTQQLPENDRLVTLCGDSFHPMTMYRGEAFNHGVTDAAALAKQLGRVQHDEISLREALHQYEDEVLARTHDAVLLSRQACLDAHDLHNLKSDSPLVSKRARILEHAKLAVVES